MTTQHWPNQQPEHPFEQPSAWSYATEPVPVEEGRRRRLPILVAAATVLAVVLGGVAYAGMRLWYGSGAQPEDAAPATVAAFARLDLSPGYGQRLKLNNLIQKFPQESGKDAIAELEAEIFDEVGIGKEAYRKHIEPWFGKRIGVGLWFDAEKKPYGLVVLNSTDDAAARAGMAAVRGEKGKDLGFVVRDGHVLVAAGNSNAQAAADAAAGDAARETLAASAKFRRGAGWLPAQQTGLAWVDFDRLGPLGALASPLGLGGASLAPPRPGRAAQPPTASGLLGLTPLGSGHSQLKGQLIVGASATDNGVEFRFRTFGTGTTVPADDVWSIVDSLPSDTALAASVRMGELGDVGHLVPDELSKTGNPFAALSGARLTVAVAAVGETVELLATADTTTAEQAKALADSLKLFGDEVAEVTVTAKGSRVELRTKGYGPGGGKLSGHALYREALAGAPDRAYAVLYLDVQRLLADEMSEKERRNFAAVKAIGLAVGAEDDDQVGLLRVVIK